MSLLTICLLQLAVSLSFAVADCPKLCSCIGTETIVLTCTGLGLDSWPSTIPQHTSTVNVSHNEIGFLDTAENVHTTSVESIDISYNLLEKINGQWILQYPFLKSLNITRNKIKKLDFALSSNIQKLILNFNSMELLDVKHLMSFRKLKELHLEGNTIRLLKSSDVNSVSETNSPLETLSLRNNSVSAINGDSFSGLTNLKHIYLAHNKIRSVSKDAFQVTTKLEVLDLSYNEISAIADGTLQKLDHLQFLSLSNNRLVKIPGKLPALQWLDVSYNRLAKISESCGSNIYQHDVLLLGGNPFICDCHLQWLKDFLETRKYLQKYMNVEHSKFFPTCSGPSKIANKGWDILQSDEFICEKSNFETADSAKEEDAVNFIASHIGDSYIKLEWDFQEGLLSKKSSCRINYHPFGRRNLLKSKVIENRAGKYMNTLQDLIEGTPYVVCLQVLNENGGQDYEKCLEIVTKDSESENSKETWVITDYLFWSCLFICIICLLSYVFDNTLYVLVVNKLFEKMRENSVEKNHNKKCD
ncbi:hypothetical protein FSP39_019659 [Pinctada imbricata]|uniref:LRRCT domain-containing protein n=1 Tax=Pinctada imbricata TaxID=66713 RepID=A0AA89C5S8_PINIB|nr:hypothetical protein FSP39_019659 [Pinctada imbricata]